MELHAAARLIRERLYLCAPGHPVYLDRVQFRDYLRRYPDAAAAYGALKQKLSVESNGDWDLYTGGKAAFIADILRRGAMLPETDRTRADGRR